MNHGVAARSGHTVNHIVQPPSWDIGIDDGGEQRDSVRPSKQVDTRSRLCHDRPGLRPVARCGDVSRAMTVQATHAAPPPSVSMAATTSRYAEADNPDVPSAVPGFPGSAKTFHARASTGADRERGRQRVAELTGDRLPSVGDIAQVRPAHPSERMPRPTPTPSSPNYLDSLQPPPVDGPLCLLVPGPNTPPCAERAARPSSLVECTWN